VCSSDEGKGEGEREGVRRKGGRGREREREREKECVKKRGVVEGAEGKSQHVQEKEFKRGRACDTGGARESERECAGVHERARETNRETATE